MKVFCVNCQKGVELESLKDYEIEFGRKTGEVYCSECDVTDLLK